MPEWEGKNAESGGPSSSASKGSMRWGRKEKKRGCSSRGKPGGDGSGRRGYHEPDIGIAFAEMFESSDSDIPGERGGRVSFSS